MTEMYTLEPVEEQVTQPPSYLHLEFLKTVTADTLLREYLSVAGPGLMEHFALMPAKGGSGQYAYKHDQSMLTHVLNGLFPTMRIARRLGEHTDDELRLFLVAYTLHDLDKVLEHLGGDSPGPTEIARLQEEIVTWATRLGLSRLLPNMSRQLNDLAFLVRNTHRKYNTNFNLAAYPGGFYLDLKRLNRARDLLPVADVMSYEIKTPAQANDPFLRRAMTGLSRDTLFLIYHQVADVRGLLTNVINSAVIGLLKDQGCEPLLFFPNGVVYLSSRPTLELAEPQAQVFQATRNKLSSLIGNRLAETLPGAKRDGKGLKTPAYYHLFFDVPHLLRLGAKLAEEKVNNMASGKRLESMQQYRNRGETGWAMLDFDLTFEPDKRGDLLAEYCIYAEGKLTEAGIPHSDVRDATLSYLGLSNLRAQLDRIPSTGGVQFGWYWLAGRYLAANRGLSPEDIHERLWALGEALGQTFANRLTTDERTFADLETYLSLSVDINGQSPVDQTTFSKELTQYEGAKVKGRDARTACALCSTPFEAEEQEEADVIFQPQLYTNKNPLFGSKMKRGICPICALELMLRQVFLKGKYQLQPGKKYEDQKIKYLYVYPAYFFTAETSLAMRKLYEEALKDFNPYHVRKALLDKGYQLRPEDFLSLESFSTTATEDVGRILRMDFPKQEHTTFYFLGLPGGATSTDTESWTNPAYLALLLPLLANVKVVVTDSPYPPYHSGEDFLPTVIYDTPHHFLKHILKTTTLRLNEVLPALKALTAAIVIQLHAIADGKDPNWNRINALARDLATDPLYVFHYLEVWHRNSDLEVIPRDTALQYLRSYAHLGGDERGMGVIAGLVDRYIYRKEGEAKRGFYLPDSWKSHSLVRPISVVADVIINSEPTVNPDDLYWQAVGELRRALERMRRGEGSGIATRFGAEQQGELEGFVKYFLAEAFHNYCNGERAVFRERLNRIKAGAEAYYLSKYAYRKETAPEEEPQDSKEEN